MVYVSCAERREIIRFEMDRDTGVLVRLGVTAVPGGSGPSPQSMPLAVSPDKQFIYAALRTSPYPVVTFRIAPNDGNLQFLGWAQLPGSMSYIATDSDGRFLLGASLPDSLVSVSRIGSDGRVAESPAQILTGIRKAHSVLQHPLSGAVYIAALGDNEIRLFGFDRQCGRLDVAAQHYVRAKNGAGPRHLALNPSGNRLYCINETDGTIDAYRVDLHDGALSHLQNIGAMPVEARRTANERTADVHVTPDGRFLYSSERTHNTISAYSIDPNSGLLSRIGSFATEDGPRAFYIDPTGNFLLSAGQVSGRLATHHIGQEDGRLTCLGTYQAGACASWVSVVDLGVLSAARPYSQKTVTKGGEPI